MMFKKSSLRASVVGFGLLAFSGSSFAGAELHCQVMPQLFQIYLRFHYLHKKMTDDLKKHAIDQFVKSLDPSKTLLLQSDVDSIRDSLSGVFRSMENGNCSSIIAVNDVMVQRAQANEEYVKSIITPDYKIDDSITLVTDPEKRSYSKNDTERKELLRKMVAFQMSNYLVAKTKPEEARKQLIHSYELVTKRLKERKPQDRLVDFMEAFAMGLDPHSSFMSADALEDFQIQMRLSLEGIGASLSSQDGFTVIEEAIPGGAADRLGVLKPKDKIIAVAQDGQPPVNVIDMDLPEVVKLIRGKKGTKVKLTILRQGDKTETFDVAIIRDKIDIKEQAAKITYETRKVGDKSLKIGVIDLPSFYGGGRDGRSSYGDMAKLLVEANKAKVDGLVLDLSRNGGGLLEDAVRIAGLFIKKGGVVATKGTDQKLEVLADKDDDVQYSGPLVVLTSRLSASASEILAGALKDYGRAVIVGGDHTYGKGTVQVVTDLPQGMGAMKVTTGMFFVPGGKSTQHIGVDADIELPSAFSTDDLGEKTMDYSLPPQTIPKFVSDEANGGAGNKHWTAVDNAIIEKLKSASKDRVAKEPKFAEVIKNLEEAKKNKGVLKLAEVRKKAEEDKTKEDADKPSKKKSAKEKAKANQAPVVQEGVNIAADLVAMVGSANGASVMVGSGGKKEGSPKSASTNL